MSEPASVFLTTIMTHVDHATRLHPPFRDAPDLLCCINDRVVKLQQAVVGAAIPTADTEVSRRLHQLAGICINGLIGLAMLGNTAPPPPRQPLPGVEPLPPTDPQPQHA